MNKSFEVYKEIYKPYRYTFKGKSIILETTSGNFVVKESSEKLKELFNYLLTRGFNNFPKIIDNSRSNTILYEYIDDISYPKEQRAIDLIKVVSNLHKNTSYYKDVTLDKYKEIYENIKSNITYLNDKYDKYYDEFYSEVYLSPSKYLFMCNYTKIKSNLSFLSSELDKYLDLVKELKSVRVSTIHNNLRLNHFIKSDKDYIISWDNYKVDSPVLDLVNFYKNEYFNLNFESILNTYFSNFKLSEDEEKLLFILISLPDEICFDSNELISTSNIRKILDYIYKTENLIRPYYFKNQKEE